MIKAVTGTTEVGQRPPTGHLTVALGERPRAKEAVSSVFLSVHRPFAAVRARTHSRLLEATAKTPPPQISPLRKGADKPADGKLISPYVGKFSAPSSPAHMARGFLPTVHRVVS